MKDFVILLVLFAAILGPAGVIGLVGRRTMAALGRNPSSAPKILLAMIVILIFAVTLSVVGMLVVLQIYGTSDAPVSAVQEK